MMGGMRGTLRPWRFGFLELRISERQAELQIWMVVTIIIWLVQHSSQIYGFEAQS
jgi:hypothetical protein